MVSSEPVLLIVAADRRELVALNGARRLGTVPVALAAAGVGRLHAARAVREAAGKQALAGVVSAGWCGALDPALRIGDIVVADRVLSLDPPDTFETRRPDGDPSAVGPVITVDHFVGAAQEKRRLRGSGAIAVEMEAAGAAEEARRLGVPFYCIRAVSDAAETSFRLDFNRALRPADGRFSAARIVAMAGLDPARWRELLALRRATITAAEALGRFLNRCEFSC